jgi:hypothetical protein
MGTGCEILSGTSDMLYRGHGKYVSGMWRLDDVHLTYVFMEPAVEKWRKYSYCVRVCILWHSIEVDGAGRDCF